MARRIAGAGDGVRSFSPHRFRACRDAGTNRSVRGRPCTARRRHSRRECARRRQRVAPHSSVPVTRVHDSTDRHCRCCSRPRHRGCDSGTRAPGCRGDQRRIARSPRRVMTAVVIYLLLRKATMTSFAGMGSLPQIRQDFVETRAAISDQQLSQAVLTGRATIGPMGVYVVAVGYFAGGWLGAVAGWLAMITPALIAIPLLTLTQRWLHLPRIRAAVD